jgi:serine/threonine protein kinase
MADKDGGEPVQSEVMKTDFLGAGPPSKYIKQRLIGKGAYGEAWMVQRASDGEVFVAKVMDLQNTPEKRRKYAFAEIRCLKDCNHPNVIQYIEDSGTDGEEIIIIMELADACDLGTQLRNGNVTFTEREAGILFTQLVLALHHIHRKRVIHRDIKSGNIFLTTCGLLKIGDFGFSQQYDQTVSDSVAGTFLGTPYYLSPEMWRSKRYGKKTDVWAAGVVLYETLAHRRPFQGSSLSDLKRTVLDGKIDAIPDVGREMMELIYATLNPDPNRRPSTTELLAMPLMQHYTTMFHNIVVKDAKISPSVKQRIITAIADAQDDVKHNNNFVEDTEDPRYESPVKKDTDGVWKDRVLILQPPQLIMTLAHGKEAAPGTDRSKRIQLEQITSVTKMDDDGKNFKFGVELVNGSVIVLSVTSSQQRDTWMGKLHTALGM